MILICQVRAIGMGSPELLQLVEGCPPGGETLIMRMLHILTESGKKTRAHHARSLCIVVLKCLKPTFLLPELALQ